MNFAAALTHAQKALELDPGFMKAYDNLGLCLEAIGRIDEAIQSYQQAVRLNEEKHSSSPWPSLNLGALLLRLERSDEAEPYLRESLKEDPRFPKAHFQLGLFLEKRNRYSEAIQELEQAIAFDSSYAEPYYALGRIYRRVGDERDAQKAWRQFQEVSARRREKEKPRKLSR